MKDKQKQVLTNLAKTLIILALATLINFGLYETNVITANLLMIYFISVLIIIIETTGYLWGILSSIACVFLFNYFFTLPLFTLEITDPNYVITFIMFLVLAILTSTLTTKLQNQVQISRHKEKQTKDLYEISRSYLNISGLDNIVYNFIDGLHHINQQQCVIYIAKNFTELSSPYYIKEHFPKGITLENETPANWCLANIAPAGCGTAYYSNSEWKYLPINGKSKVLGVVGIYCGNEDLSVETSIFFNTIISQMALAIERELLSQEQENNRVDIEKEKLRNNLLRSISHDLRTPLTAIAGSSNLIVDQYDVLDKATIISLAKDISSDALWLNNMVENLLNMTRIEDGKLLINKEAEVLDDIIYEAVGRINKLKDNREIKVHLPSGVELVPMDGKLIIQVLVNLLDNAIKHTKENSIIELNVYAENKSMVFDLSDNGGGIDKAILPNLFESFITGTHENGDAHRGTGLGLSICQAIIQAHNGTIQAFNNDKGGATIRFTLPL